MEAKEKIEQILKKNVLLEINKSGENEKYAQFNWLSSWGMNTYFQKGVTNGVEEYSNLRIIEVLEGLYKNANDLSNDTVLDIERKLIETKSQLPQSIEDSKDDLQGLFEKDKHL